MLIFNYGNVFYFRSNGEINEGKVIVFVGVWDKGVGREMKEWKV